ncbi:S9 family peptidase [Zeaxanthinibacter enoshimensis]|uniref:Dipeptidyl-peptidase-4 n=1 Tax=Zeaxanthinibacter enoshimensis TaxID=392009 RepID=A0A4R6TP07_9FLAO|nr:S9 family peptidase [Zeaxanthinibacter enoshimensis]TDQ33314.1 dipeptidyl-peptidase-4 [Zeaxanthinibacter enoshimensis]
MKIVPLLSFLCLSVMQLAIGQQKQISLEEIYDGTFGTEGLEVLNSMDNGKQYSVLNFNRSSRVSTVDLYNYETQEKVETLVTSADFDEIPYFTSYEFSDDESKVILATEVEPIFRHSRLGIYYVYDVESKELTRISEQKIQEPSLSPDGSKVAYVFENNLYVLDLQASETTQVTNDGKINSIINGVTDWVYEEEFAFVKAFEWNSDGSRIAFLRFDESRVPEFSMDVFGQELYPYQYRFKYPKAGEENAGVSLNIYQLKKGETTKVDLGDPYYIPRIKWRNHPQHLSVQTLNRHQNKLVLYDVNAKNMKVSVLLTEKDDAYVDIHDNLTFLADDSFIWTSERDGYNHLYLYNEDGELMNQITKGPWEVTAYYGYDQEEDRVYYQSTENGSINRDVYAISSGGGDKLRLTKQDGTNLADFSADFTYFINTFSNAVTPPVYTLHLAEDGELVKELEDNSELKDMLKDYEFSPKDFSTLSINGNDLNMWMVKPADFDPSKEYPLLLFQYSGPGSQQVANRWMGTNDYWHQILAAKGIIVACVDGRGTGLKGRDFKKVTYQELGKYEVEDQIAAAKELSELPYIDPARTGIWGWSYGGFMSTNCLLKGNDTFEMAVAVAPVTSWRFYDTIYTERYMRTPQENASGYDENSPLNYPELLEGDYLLVHGSGDDNVHVQNTMRMIEALVQANKQFDWAIYPDRNHGIHGGNTRLHLYTKMTDFMIENLLKTDNQ